MKIPLSDYSINAGKRKKIIINACNNCFGSRFAARLSILCTRRCPAREYEKHRYRGSLRRIVSEYPLFDNNTNQKNCAASKLGGNQGGGGGVDETPASERKINEVLVAVCVNANLVQSQRKEISEIVCRYDLVLADF
jgi:hypothetical protein